MQYHMSETEYDKNPAVWTNYKIPERKCLSETLARRCLEEREGEEITGLPPQFTV